jgi:acyl-CoA thioesterase-1
MSASPTPRWSLAIAIILATFAAGSLITVAGLFSTTVAQSSSTGVSASPTPTTTSDADDGSTGTPNSTAAPSVTPPAPPALVVPVAPLQVLTIGDSIMRGWGLTPADAWPKVISLTNGWDVTNLGCDDAGFVVSGKPSQCADTLVGVSSSVAALHPDLIIIEGSSNDFGQSNTQLLAATIKALAILRSQFPNADIVGLSTVWSDTAPPSQLADVDSQVQQAVTAVGGRYFDIGQPLGGHPEFLQNDGVHPTATGQAALAAAIQTAIMAE